MMVPVVPMLETKCVMPALGVAPDFRPGAFVVRQRVVRIGELVEHDALALGHHLSASRAPLHAAGLGRQHQFGAEGAHGLAALDALVLRHDQDHAVAAHRRRHRQRDAGIARGGLDQRVAGLDAPRARPCGSSTGPAGP
jgi:hypothetical protein